MRPAHGRVAKLLASNRLMLAQSLAQVGNGTRAQSIPNLPAISLNNGAPFGGT
jgi:hypothetical protein